MDNSEINVIETFLCKVNKVTAPFRHGNEISEQALTDLSNAQIDVEKWLKSMPRTLESTPVEGDLSHLKSLPIHCGSCGGRRDPVSGDIVHAPNCKS